jgi:thiamine biosynthesis lipoprotein
MWGADRYQASEPHMGTLVSITLYAETSGQAQRGFVVAFGRIAELDSILSDYNPQSELSRVCDATAPLSRDLSRILQHAQRVARDTHGAFDITAGPLTRLWRQARAQKRLPGPEQIAAALGRSGYRKLGLSDHGQRAHCRVEGMQLDPGAIAKGYAADEALRSLLGAGIRSALVALSGDIAVGDPPPGRDGWRVRVQNGVILLANAAVSTSGDEFQFAEIGGVRYSHIIDPRTGMPLRSARTVSVIAPTGIEADSLSTALNVALPHGVSEILDVRPKPGEQNVGWASMLDIEPGH